MATRQQFIWSVAAPPNGVGVLNPADTTAAGTQFDTLFGVGGNPDQTQLNNLHAAMVAAAPAGSPMATALAGPLATFNNGAMLAAWAAPGAPGFVPPIVPVPAPAATPWYKKWQTWAITGGVLAAIIGAGLLYKGCSSNGNPAPPTATSSTPASPPAPTSTQTAPPPPTAPPTQVPPPPLPPGWVPVPQPPNPPPGFPSAIPPIPPLPPGWTPSAPTPPGWIPTAPTTTTIPGAPGQPPTNVTIVVAPTWPGGASSGSASSQPAFNPPSWPFANPKKVGPNGIEF